MTESEITIEVMADTGSPLAPGLFQGNVDGDRGLRRLHQRQRRHRLPAAGRRSHVGQQARPERGEERPDRRLRQARWRWSATTLFNPDPSAMTSCADQAGAATGLPNIAALANDVNELLQPDDVHASSTEAEACPIPEGDRIYTLDQPARSPRSVEQHPDRTNGMFMVAGRPADDAPVGDAERRGAAHGRRHDGQRRARCRAATSSPPTRRASQRDQGRRQLRVQRLRRRRDDQDGERGGRPGRRPVHGHLRPARSPCYTRDLARAGRRRRSSGTYVWMQFLPFEEADTNAAPQGLRRRGRRRQGRHASAPRPGRPAIAFQQAVNQIVDEQGPNAITRASLIEALASIERLHRRRLGRRAQPDRASPRATCSCRCETASSPGCGRRKRGTMDCDRLEPRGAHRRPRRRSRQARLTPEPERRRQT